MNIKSYHQRKIFWEIFATFNFCVVLLAAQINCKIESDIDFSETKDTFCEKMTARRRVFVLFCFFFLSIVTKFDKKCANSTQRSLSRLTIVSAKSKIHSLRRGYLSPSNSIVLEIETALLVISVANCRF